ncbi:hypothetical protein BKA70DRAFT_410903 [Coprinopsis sp. MPI-PUGE-AT-0042]|nr:hypothetical protein BKA70DRAFT_410903 [Coprinopsis sp. MPI-PUGE-AT-0042]
MRLQHPFAYALFFLAVGLAAAESLSSALPSYPTLPGSCGIPFQSSASAGVPCDSDTSADPHPISTLPPPSTHPPYGITLDPVATSSPLLPTTSSDSVVESLPSPPTATSDLPVDPYPSHSPEELLPQSTTFPVTLEGDQDVPGGAPTLTVLDQATPSKRIITSQVTAVILPHTTILGEVFLTEDLSVSSEFLPQPQSTLPNSSLEGGACSYRRVGTTMLISLLMVVVAFSLAF